MRQIELAMRMNDVERRIREREFMMMSMQMAEHMREAEEERLLMRVMEESKHESCHNLDPSNPDVDNMTYEQLVEMGETAGKVSLGLKQN
jgi:hypothetical protein